MPASDIDPFPTPFHPLSLAGGARGQAVCIFSLLNLGSTGIKAVALLVGLSPRPGSPGSGTVRAGGESVARHGKVVAIVGMPLVSSGYFYCAAPVLKVCLK